MAIWLSIVILTTAHHEFWRDEVRALSLARAARWPVDLYSLTKFDGHPVLWYLLLFVGKSILDTPLVLPIFSVGLAVAATALLAFASPFRFWLRWGFIFSGLPLYEYSVMARNYGISMFLLFSGAWFYERRSTHPLALAILLALLANTNVHSAILALLIAGVWVVDTCLTRPGNLADAASSLYLPLAIVGCGVVLCAIWTVPRENTILTSVRSGVSLSQLAYAVVDAIVRPNRTFSAILPHALPPSIGAVLLYVTVAGLVRWPALFVAALGAQVAFGVLFRLVYPGYYRHQGLFLVFLVCLYWLAIRSPAEVRVVKTTRPVFEIGLHIGLMALILGNVVEGRMLVLTDLNRQMSSSKEFAAFLRNSAVYHDAILIPEPDILLESLPYYVDNAIYLPRERRFSPTVAWTTDSRHSLTLGELVATAREVMSRFGRPALVVLGHGELAQADHGEKTYPYQKAFSWTSSEYADFNQSMTIVGDFNAAEVETYRVYAIK